MDEPATYRIRVSGRVSESWAMGFCGIKPVLTDRPGKGIETELVGEMTDQAALLGMINALYNFGYALLSVERIPESAEGK